MGAALYASFREAGVPVREPYGRGDAPDLDSIDVVFLAVPDAAIEDVAHRIDPGPIVAHLSGATPLALLSPHESFVLHPLLTVTGAADRFQGAFATVSASSERARDVAQSLAATLGLLTVPLEESDRAAYHAAASIASNFLVTVEGLAEDVAARVGLDRDVLVPLVRASVDNWARLGARQALTGPIARGDHETVARQRDAIEKLLPEQLPLFDALVTATEALAAAR